MFIFEFGNVKKCKLLCITLFLIITFFLFLIWYCVSNEESELPITPSPLSYTTRNSTSIYTPPHTLCVIVPFRNVFNELLEFIPHISAFLNRQSIKFYITVINQVDEYRFNRGSVINVGFRVITEQHPDCDYIVMHDVDLLPLSDNISYAYPGDHAFHVSSRELHPLGIVYPQFYVGGILIMTNSDYMKVNGFSNQFWGWGHEGTDFAGRLQRNLVDVERPDGKKFNLDRTNAFRNIHSVDRKRDLEVFHKNIMIGMINLDRDNGVRNVNYTITAKHSSTIDQFFFTIFNVKLECDKRLSPWCVPDD